MYVLPDRAGVQKKAAFLVISTLRDISNEVLGILIVGC